MYNFVHGIFPFLYIPIFLFLYILIVSLTDSQLIDGNLDIFRIEVLDKPFKTNEVFIPSESSSYEEMYNSSYRYWNPKFKNVPEECSEYLVQGRVKILEKVGEIKKK